MQTEERLDEAGLPEDPLPAEAGKEPITAQKNLETGSNGSLMEEPEAVEVIPVPECSYVDDWIDSELYKYSFELHYDRLVKGKHIRIEQVKRPEVPEECKDMTAAQRLDHNLNPEGLSILSKIECEYGQATLRHKSANLAKEEVIVDLYTRAKATIELLEANMVRPDISSTVLFEHYKDVTKKNVIKLLIRVKKLYDARDESI